MGVVYLATQVFPERRVALKLLSSDLAADPAFRERFVRESNAAASTEHPHIVPVYGAGESDGQLYLAMRFIEGKDLRTLLENEGTLVPERAARICAEVAEALEAAHERGLVHRDVKPGNVLLDARDRAYLSDFGLIRATRTTPRSRRLVSSWGRSTMWPPSRFAVTRSTGGRTSTRSGACCTSA